jgi:hypothetical protein
MTLCIAITTLSMGFPRVSSPQGGQLVASGAAQGAGFALLPGQSAATGLLITLVTLGLITRVDHLAPNSEWRMETQPLLCGFGATRKGRAGP